MSPLVSIITRTKNRPLLLPRACDSVLGQTTIDWEHVLVNDAGDSSVVESIVEPRRARYGDRLRVIHRERSTGMEAASNAGIRASHGRYLVIHDDDDSWHGRFLEKTTSMLERLGPEDPVQGVVTHSTRVVEQLEANTVTEVFRHAFVEGLQPIRLWRVLEENAFPPISFLFRRSAWDALGPFDGSLPVLGDWEFNVRFLQRFDITVLPEMLAYYHHRTEDAANIYANTVTARDDLHRSTEAALIERWASSGNATLNALAQATTDARRVLLQRRKNKARRDAITALREEIAVLESHHRP